MTYPNATIAHLRRRSGAAARLAQLAVVIAACSATAATAATLVPANLAPRAAAETVRIEIEGKTSESLAYKAFGQSIQSDGGDVLIRALARDGSELAKRTLRIGADESGVVMLTGVGSEAIPFA